MRERAARARDAASTSGRRGSAGQSHDVAKAGTVESPAAPSVAVPWRNGDSRAALAGVRWRGHWKQPGGFSDSRTRSYRTSQRSHLGVRQEKREQEPTRCQRLPPEQPGSRNDPRSADRWTGEQTSLYPHDEPTRQQHTGTNCCRVPAAGTGLTGAVPGCPRESERIPPGTVNTCSRGHWLLAGGWGVCSAPCRAYPGSQLRAS